MDEFSYELKIPRDRVAVLIGKKGETKQELEKDTGTRIVVDSKEGDVQVIGEDSLMIYTVKEIIKAIGRGFNPDIAMLLLKQDYSLELMNMADYVKSKNQILRLKGRVIGKEGKARRNIEVLTDTSICVYGKTIGIVGRIEDVANARRAVDSILLGSPHSAVYKWLEKKRREMKTQEFEMKKNDSEDII